MYIDKKVKKKKNEFDLFLEKNYLGNQLFKSLSYGNRNKRVLCSFIMKCQRKKQKKLWLLIFRLAFFG